MNLDDLTPHSENGPVSTHSSLNHSFSMSDTMEAVEKLRSALGLPVQHERSLLEPFEMPVKDCVAIHPDCAAWLPPAFFEACARAGIQVRQNRWLPRSTQVKGAYTMLVMGRPAEMMHRLKFDADLAAAMQENTRFLRLMQEAGLAST